MNWKHWKENIENLSVLEWVEHGVPATFNSTPQPFRCHNRKFNKREAEFIDQEISRLLKNKYISVSNSNILLFNGKITFTAGMFYVLAGAYLHIIFAK